MPLIKQQTGSVFDFVAVREIEGKTLCLRTEKKGEREYKAVVETTPVNFSLLSEGEQEVILEGFRVFLARLSYPIMIHVRIEPYELASYLAQIEYAKGREGISSAFVEMADDHIEFVHSLAASRALLQRNFYLVVSAERQKSKGKSQTELADIAKSQLDLRCNDIIQDLERMGLIAKRLDTMELTHYYQSCLHAQTAKTFPLPKSAVEAAGRLIRSKIQRKQEKPVSYIPSSLTVAHGEDEIQQVKPQEKDHPDVIKLAELLAPSALDIKTRYVRLHQYDTDEYIRGYAIIGYPSQVSAGWLDRPIQIDEPHIEIAMHIQPLNSVAYVGRLSRKLTGLSCDINVRTASWT